MSRIANMTFFEAGMDIIPLLNQVDVNSDQTGDWVKLRDYEKIYLLIAKYGSEDVDTLGVQILQGTDSSGSGSKKVDAPYRYWYKQGTLTSQTVWTAGQLATADDILGIGSAAPSGGTLVVATDTDTSPILLMVELLTEYLDVANGFDWATIKFAGSEVDNSCLISAWGIMFGNHFPQAVPLSAIS